MNNFLRLLIYRGSAAIGTLVFTIYVYIFSSKEEASLTFSFVLIIYLLSMVARFGLDIVVVKDISRMNKRDSRDLFSKVLMFLVLSSLFLSLIIYCLYLIFEKNQELLYLALNLVPFSVWMPISCYFRAQEERFKSALFEPGNIFLFTTLFLFLSQSSSVLIVFSFVSWFAFISVLIYLYTSRYISMTDKNFHGWLQLVKSGLGYMALAVISYLTLWLPAFFIKLSSPNAFIDYNLAVRLIAPFTFIITTVDFYLSSRFSKSYFESNYVLIIKDIKLFRKFFLVFGSIYLILTLLVMLITSNFGYINTSVVNFYATILIG
ncbi:hypothetical protein NB620_07210, partial [Vibrio alginolyticus]|uniref:hypothetical protein n=1 Tax=Vibrio alginolyticus TaxID=663 RepID=UPI00215D5B42